ncbi:MAG TPA: hypothetical protein VES97_07470 [Solirubrobacteraceae bacterium]|nr:hypothetical protein [Solirubrobacteraceae bacterium]
MTSVAVLAAVLAGCGSTPKSSSAAQASAAPGSCPQTVLEVLGKVVARAYREGVSSERTAIARRVIAGSAALRQAVEGDNAAAARAAAQALVADGHITNLRVMRGSSTLADVGGPALAPLRGTITGAGGAPIGSYVASVWSDGGFLAETDGLAEGAVALRVNGRSVGGSFPLPTGTLPAEGTLTRGRVLYRYTSFPAETYPSGSARVYLLKSVRSTTAFCGPTSEDTLVNTLSHVASLIYAGEAGSRTVPQVHRVQRNQPLLLAVSRHDPAAAKLAIEGLLNEHVVRLRVNAGGRLLADVGGPYVLAPVRAPLRLGGRTIGNLVLSIQDDEGYLRLAKRLAGLDVLMYMNPAHPKLVKNSLGAAPGAVPASGSYQYRGRTFRVFTLNAGAFPSGPLRIQVLIPIPYS